MKRRCQNPESSQPRGPDPRPISVRVPIAVRMTGISRSKLYELIKNGDVQIVKVGSSTLIPVDSLEQFIDAHKT